MTYVIAGSCIKDDSCVEACPVDCIHPKPGAPDFETAALGPAAMAGVTVERVRVRRGPVDVTLGVDGTSGEVRAISFVGRNGEGEFGNYEIALSDYRAVGGLRVPHSERAAFDGVADPALTRTLQTITLDAPLDAALFSRGGGD